MKIRSKLEISTFVVALFLLTLGGLSSLLIHRLAHISRDVVETQNTALQLTEIKGLVENILSLTELHIRSEDGVSMGLLAEKIDKVEEQLQNVLEQDLLILSRGKDDSEIRQFSDAWGRFRDVRLKVIGLSDLFFNREAEELMTHYGLPAFANSFLILENKLAHHKSSARSLAKKVAAAETASTIFISGIAVFIAILVMVGGLVITRSITNPLLILADYLKSHSLGDKDLLEGYAGQNSSELKNLVRSLEIQVQNRTADLQKSNRLLEEEIDVRKLREIEIQDRELRFRDLVDALPLSYFITDHGRSLIFANRKTAETFERPAGAREDPSANNDFMRMLVPEDRQLAEAHLDSVGESVNAQWHRYSCQRQDGSEFPCEILTTPVKYVPETGTNQHILVDISERLEKEELKKQKEVAESANKAISEWLSFVAHELRNPLAGIIGFANFGQKKSEKAPEGKLFYYFKQIGCAANRLEVLLTDLLDLSKIETGEMTFEMMPVNIKLVAEEVQIENGALLIERGLELLIETPDSLGDHIPVVCDRFRIGQVIRNLISNAIKFTPAEKRIVISFEKTLIQGGVGSEIDVEGIRLDIRDEGIGIPEDQLEEIFNKYKQSRKTRKGEGTGLGLPICKQIVEAHGGQIWVNSIENSGSTFSFQFPIGNPG